MRYFICLLMVCVCAASALKAQETTRDEEVIGLHYLPADYISLSRLSWKYGLHDLSNDEALDLYIGLVNCPLKKTYFENDFLWQRIREGYRRDIRYYSPKYPDRFQMVSGIELGRYDFASSAFIIPELYQLSRTGNLGMIQYPGIYWECNNGDDHFEYFAPNIILSADNPFTLDRIPVAPEKARELIEKLTYTDRNNQQRRTAVLRIRARISDIKDYDPRGSSISTIIYRGQLDEIAVYEDIAMTRLIWRKSFKDLER